MLTIVNESQIMTATIAASFKDGDSDMMLVRINSQTDMCAPAPKATMKAPTFKAKKPMPRIVAKSLVDAAENTPAVVPVKKTWSRKPKPVVCKNTEMVFSCAREAAQTLFPETDIIKTAQQIRNCCGKYNRTKAVHGFEFAYVQTEE